MKLNINSLWSLNTILLLLIPPFSSIQVCQVPVNSSLCKPVSATGGAHNDVHALYQLSHWSIFKIIFKNLEILNFCSAE